MLQASLRPTLWPRMTLKLGLRQPVPFPVDMLSFVGIPRLTGVEDVSEGRFGFVGAGVGAVAPA